MITLRQLGYLVAVAETGHFRQAADRMNVTQPTLSEQLRALEDRLGVTLIERSRGGIMPTDIGAAVVERARAVLRDVQDIVDLAQAAGRELRGTVRVGVLPTLGPYLLPSLVPSLHERYPDLELYVREDRAEALRGGLKEGRYELILSSAPLAGEGFTIVELFDEPLEIAAAGDHRLARKQAVSRHDLSGEKVLSLEPGHLLHEQVQAICADFGAELRTDYEGTSLDTLRQMVAMGMGLAFLPALYVRSEIRPPEEVSILNTTARPPSRRIAMAWRKQSPRADRFRELADVVRAIVGVRLPEVSLVDAPAG